MVEEAGLAAAVLDDPVLGIVWLVERLAQQGQGMEVGQVVLFGLFIRPIECPRGCRIETDYGDSETLSCRF